MTDKERDALHAAINLLHGWQWLTQTSRYIFVAADGEHLGYAHRGEREKCMCTYYGRLTFRGTTRHFNTIHEGQRWIEQCWYHAQGINKDSYK